MAKLSRTKGAVGERQAVDLLRRAFPEAARRSAGEESQEDQGRDVKNTPGYVFQVQLARRPTPEAKLVEAQAATRGGDVPVALTRRSAKRRKGKGSASGEWLATLPALLFVELVRDKHRYRDDLSRALEACQEDEQASMIYALEERNRQLEKERAELKVDLEKATELLARSKAFDVAVEDNVDEENPFA